MDTGDPARGDDHRDRHVPLEDLVPSGQRAQPELMKRTGGAQKPSAGFHPDEPADDAAASGREERDQHHGGDVQLVVGGQQPRRDQNRLPRSRHTDPAGGRGRRQPRVVEWGAVEPVVKMEVNDRWRGEEGLSVDYRYAQAVSLTELDRVTGLRRSRRLPAEH